MYFVDRESITGRLNVLNNMITYFEETTKPSNLTETLAYERMVHLIIDSVLDVGNAMIDGFIMRDPGSYDDIIDILMDEKVISNEVGSQLKKLIPLRKHLLQDYTETIIDKMVATMNETIQSIKSFPIDVNSYLTKELGPVNAFSNGK
jgi:uncharacterized protein YutE (UPF0331/DUF86 family)